MMEEDKIDIESPAACVLTDVCSKSHRKITYTANGTAVLIETTTNNSWNSLEQLTVLIRDIFLPKGYPNSVSSDYLEYQIWDTCQAFCSSISGTLAMRAVLQGIGVGSEATAPVSAAITWLIKDGTGMVGSILFAWFKGSKLDSDCKKWRLFADILNDIAMFLELFIPYAVEYSMHMLCIATALKALVGTAGSSTRAALVTHQAIKGNIADVSAKDGSQEIFINLCAFVFGIFLLKNVTETKQIWTVMCTATLFHLIFNYNAVKCLKINVFNTQRYLLCLRTYLPTSIVPTVEQINQRESVFLTQGMSDTELSGFSIVLGACLKKAMKTQEVSGALFSNLMVLFQNKKYFIVPHLKRKKMYIAFQQSISDTDILKAYFHATLLGISITYLQDKKHLSVLSRCRKNTPIFRLQNLLKQCSDSNAENATSMESKIILNAYEKCEDLIEKEFVAFYLSCFQEGWDVKKHLINTGEWRTEWKTSGKKKLSFKLRPRELSFNEEKRPRNPNRPSQQMRVLFIQ